MPLNVIKELAALQKLSVGDLWEAKGSVQRFLASFAIFVFKSNREVVLDHVLCQVTNLLP